LATITAGKPQFSRPILIAALTCWSIPVAGWSFFLLSSPYPGTPKERDPGDAASFIYVAMGTILLLAIGLFLVIAGTIDFAIRSWRYRRELRSLAASLPVSSSQQ